MYFLGGALNKKPVAILVTGISFPKTKGYHFWLFTSELWEGIVLSFARLQFGDL